MKLKVKTPHILAAFFATQWAISPDWLNSAWGILAARNGLFDTRENAFEQSAEEESAMRTIAGTRPEGTRYTIVPESSRVAIIEIWGAIFPRANVYTEYCGGTSSELLIQDIKAAKANPNIDEVIFLLHTPGGDVVGTAETADAIADLGTVKKTTGYVKGLCASAGYWMASACQKIVSSRTGLIGSIGVYSAYIDDSEAMQRAGFQEIEFRSEQSPDKNLDPKTPRGKALVQVRMNDLCEPFIEDVAKYRKTTVEKVLSDFGRGDVMVAKKAKTAGMIDEIKTWDELIAAVASSNSSNGFADDSDDLKHSENSTAQTLNFSDELNSSSAAEDSAESNDSNLKPEENMSKEKEKNDAPAANDAASGKPADQAGEFATATAKEGAVAGSVIDYKAEFEKSQAAHREANERIAKLEADAREKRMTEIAGTFAGDKQENINLLTQAAEKFGEDSEFFASLVKNQKALTAQINTGALFGEKGEGGTGADTSAKGRLDAAAKKIATDEKMSFADALVVAAERNTDLYAEYEAELQK